MKKLSFLFVLLVCLVKVAVAEVAEQPVSRFTWSASAAVTSNYIWRGLYCGGPSLQVDATVGYAGFYANMWWNIGATDWTFSALNPEVDFAIGFSRWGLDINYLHCFYFDKYPDGTPSRFFDFRNHPKGGGGTTGEWRVSYRVSDRVPLRFLVSLRTFGRDGYMASMAGHDGYPAGVQPGDGVYLYLKRAYSTYIEVGYDFALGENWQLDARVGVTPAKSLYTGYEGNFAVTLVGLKLHKTWALEHCAVKGFANVMLQPWQVTKDNLIRPIADAGSQKLNMAVGCSVSLGN